MIIVITILAIAALGTILYFVIKAPKLTPKKHIVETIIGAHDELFRYRQEVRSLISDSLNIYQQHDERSLTHRYGTADRRLQDIKQKLTSADNELTAYRSAKAYKSFFEHADTAVDALRHSVSRLTELQNDSKLLEPVIGSLQQLSTLTQGGVMSTYISDDDDTAANRVMDHINHIIALADQVMQQINDVHFSADEFRHVSQSISIALKKITEDYANLRGLLETKQYEQYRSASNALPTFFARFDTHSYESILTASFAHEPELSYINNIRTHLYT